MNHFKILRKCQGKFDCLVLKVLYIKKFKHNLNVQADSEREKLFVYLIIFEIVFIVCCSVFLEFMDFIYTT